MFIFALALVLWLILVSMQISNIGGKHIVLACRTNILWDVLNQAQQIGCAAISLLMLIFIEDIN